MKTIKRTLPFIVAGLALTSVLRDARACEEDFVNSAAALHVADRIGQLYEDSRTALAEHGTPPTLAFDAFNEIMKFVRGGLGTPDDVERALRARGVPCFLMAVHRDYVGNPGLKIVDWHGVAEPDHYVHFSGEGPDVARDHRRQLGITDERENLLNLKTAGGLSTDEDSSGRTRNLTTTVAGLNRGLAPYLPFADIETARALTEAIEVALTDYLRRFIDVTPVMIENELRRSGSFIHCVAMPVAWFGPGVRVIPIHGRRPTSTTSVLSIVIAAPAEVDSAIRSYGFTAEENLQRLADVGLLGAIPKKD